MKKIIISILAVALLLTTGCSIKKNQGDLGEKRVANTFEITPKKISSSALEGENQLITIDIEITNNDKGPLGIGAGDFFIRDEKGKETNIYGQRENFGEELGKGKTLTGKAYFKVSTDYSTFSLIYQPYQTIDAQWDNLQVPSK